MIDRFAYIPELGFGIYEKPIQLPTEHISIPVDSYQFNLDSDSLFTLYLTSKDKTYIYRTYNYDNVKDIPYYFETADFDIIKDTFYICTISNVNTS